MITIVETQMVDLQFGATLQTKIRERNGNTVSQLSRSLVPKNVQEITVMATEDAKTKQLTV